MESKQVIVIRKDLKMRKGKIAAQAAHASMKIFFDLMTDYDDIGKYIMLLPEAHVESMKNWIDGSFTKVVVSVDSEEELLSLHEKAKKENLPCSLIQDEGRTEFNNVPTYTAIAIGPANPEVVNLITSNLSLI